MGSYDIEAIHDVPSHPATIATATITDQKIELNCILFFQLKGHKLEKLLLLLNLQLLD